MESSDLIIVCYTGGTAGDLISQILDHSELSLDRQRLKKPHTFSTVKEKDLFLKNSPWKSIPSHDFAFHQQSNHSILGIVCNTMDSAIWAAKRFKKLHSWHVWQEMTSYCGADDIETYAQNIIDFGKMVEQYTNNVLYLDSIISGQAIISLHQLGYQTPGAHLYSQWLLKNFK
jgi:hypothetical protein